MCAPVSVMSLLEEQSLHWEGGGVLQVACGVCRCGGLAQAGVG